MEQAEVSTPIRLRAPLFSVKRVIARIICHPLIGRIISLVFRDRIPSRGSLIHTKDKAVVPVMDIDRGGEVVPDLVHRREKAFEGQGSDEVAEHIHLCFFVFLFLFLLVIVLGLESLSSLSYVNDASAQIRTRWLPSTRALGDLNNFTTDFPAAEDTDYKLRLEAAGIRMLTTPRAAVVHTYGVRKGWALLRSQQNYATGNGGMAGKLTLLGDSRGAEWLEETRNGSRREWRAAPQRLPRSLRRELGGTR